MGLGTCSNSTACVRNSNPHMPGMPMEWANACGFTDGDPIWSNPHYRETEVETQIRPANSKAWDTGIDPKMFVDIVFANDSGPGRGRGQVKKPPPMTMKDYFDHSDIQFEKDMTVKKVKKDLVQNNQGTSKDFEELILTGAKESKQCILYQPSKYPSSSI